MSQDHQHFQLGLEWPAYVNRGLFADNFLETRLREISDWSDDEGLDEAFEAILELYLAGAHRFTSRTNEQQTERDFIRPVLDILWCERDRGDLYEVQPPLPGAEGTRTPDYAFFRSSVDRRNAALRQGSLDFWTTSICIGDAKRWTSSLDKERSGESPSAQLSNYLYRANVRWLTNGRLWRLYEREKARAGGVYFEVDLSHILDQTTVISRYSPLGDVEWFQLSHLQASANCQSERV